MFSYKRLEETMNTNNITAYKLAKETGISQSSFTDWKLGKVNPSYEKIKLLADFFGVDINYFDSDYQPTEKKDTLSEVPETYFTNAEEALSFIIKQPMVAFAGGYDLSKMTDDEVVELANDIIDLLRIAAKKYR